MKTCPVCATAKPPEEFHRRAASVDGLAARCKACQSAYDKARDTDPKRIAARQTYLASDAGKARSRVSSAEWRKRHRIKANAHTQVARALRAGKLVRQPCERCNHADYVEAHHDDYSKPLEIKWLCDPCHKTRHHELKAQGVTP